MKGITFRIHSEHLKDFNKKLRKLKKQGDSASWDLHEPSMNLIKIVNIFGNVIALQMIFKLWSPGIFTCQEIQKALKIDIKYVNDMAKYLEDLEIVKKICMGIYGRGVNGHLAMNLFAWIVLNKEE